MLRETGLRRQDHMAIFMENHPTMLVTEAAAERTGLYFTPVNSYLSAEEVAYVVNDSKSRVVVTSAAKAEVAEQLPALCPAVDRWIMVGRDGSPGGPFESWEEAVERQPTSAVAHEQLGAPMMYSSGTTGRPKGILRPMYDIHPSETSIAVLGIAMLWSFRENMVYLSPAPLYHTAPQVSVAIALRMKSTAVVMEHFDPALYLDLVGRHGVTHSQVVPTMFTRMLKLPEEIRGGGRPVLARGRHPRRGTVPRTRQAADDRVVRADPARVLRGHRGERLHLHHLRGLARTPGQRGPGRPERHPHTRRRREECPTGTSGTVWFAGATDFEYFGDPEKTASSRRDGGRTSTVGDVGYLDEDGYLYLTDRKAHMIISGGVNIYPQETENLLVTHAKVLDAAVIGVPNEDLGEEVKAVVQPVEGVMGDDALERELIAFCREHLAHFKCPRSIDFVAELPRLPTGKLYKGVLREQYWADHATRIV